MYPLPCYFLTFQDLHANFLAFDLDRLKAIYKIRRLYKHQKSLYTESNHIDSI
nr:MAG TPA: hypothetical protein [Bacteriophage sp.]